MADKNEKGKQISSINPFMRLFGTKPESSSPTKGALAEASVNKPAPHTTAYPELFKIVLPKPACNQEVKGYMVLYDESFSASAEFPVVDYISGKADLSMKVFSFKKAQDASDAKAYYSDFSVFEKYILRKRLFPTGENKAYIFRFNCGLEKLVTEAKVGCFHKTIIDAIRLHEVTMAYTRKTQPDFSIITPDIPARGIQP